MKTLACVGLALALTGCGAPASAPEPAPMSLDAGAVAAEAPPAPAPADAAAEAADPTDTTPMDAGLEAPPPPGDSAPIALEYPRCGPGPFHLVRIASRNIMWPAPGWLRDVRVSASLCPELAVRTNENGRANLAISQGSETWLRFDAPGFVPCLFGEIAVTGALAAPGLVATMIPHDLVDAVLPGYKPDRPLVHVQIQPGRADGPEACRSRAGITLSIDGMPEARILYRQPGSVATFAPGTATTSEGVALITGLPSSRGHVVVKATKTGCTYANSYGDAMSTMRVPIVRTPLHDGAVTYLTINPVM